ncbi:MAG TPA: presqualene diphosphate synthase HpnD, partial [Alphaproteobacteria bacterium]|nr:presqualene diphosphate synthase HpnD [Alphaproteobacteria bacterium]
MVLMATPYRQAMADVKARVNAAHSSFHAGMAILPKTRREAMYAVYAFCREVDDIADDGGSKETRAEGLQQWRARIADLFRGRPGDSITLALEPAIARFGLVEADFQAIIDGMAMDADKTISAPDLSTLDLYCDRVAGAVGRIAVRIFGDDSAEAMKAAHHLGRAFQMTNILRDLAEDAERERLYLPEEFLATHGIAARAAKDVLRDPNLADACRDLAAVARRHFALADKAMRACKPQAMRPARVMRGYYGAIFERLVASDWRDPAARVHLPIW